MLHPKPIIATPVRKDEVFVDCVLQYNDSYNDQILCFANSIPNPDGGTHLTGFRTALTRAINQYAKSNNLLKEKDPAISGDDVREGLVCVLSVKLPNPRFESQTKVKLVNTEIDGIVSSIVYDGLMTFFDANPSVAKKVIEKALLAARAREAARKARETVRKRRADRRRASRQARRLLRSRPGQHRDSTSSRAIPPAARPSKDATGSFQAILPIRGKLINVEKARLDKVLQNNEIRTMITAIGTGHRRSARARAPSTWSKLRYHKIIIMTDADVDGSHIRTLLLTFFYRQMPELVKGGYVYIAQPPLYLITRRRREEYVEDDPQLNRILIQLGTEDVRLQEPRRRPALHRPPAWRNPRTARVARQIRPGDSPAWRRFRRIHRAPRRWQRGTSQAPGQGPRWQRGIRPLLSNRRRPPPFQRRQPGSRVVR